MRFTRRKFLQGGAIVGAGFVSGLTWPRALAAPGAGAFAGAIDLAVARGASPAKNCLAAVEALGGFSRFVRAGDKVVVKPNPVGENRPERAVNTHPEMVEVVVQVNGKVRSRLTVGADAGEGEVRERVLSDPRIREYTADKRIRKTVYVPGKLFSIVAS